MTSPLAGRPFRKMNGLGNDFVILDLRGADLALTQAEARAIADRARGVGCDQVIALEDGAGADVAMRIWNADGGEVDACGNAARCVGALVMAETGAPAASIRMGRAIVNAAAAEGGAVRVDMGRPRLAWDEIPLAEPMDTRRIDVKLGPIDNPVLWGPSAVSMGNPHCIFFVEDVDAHALDRFGPLIENHPMFPERTNVELAAVAGPHAIRVRVWERGVGITKACGTGACAVLVAAARRGLTERRAVVTLDGGPLHITWDKNDKVIMTGPVAHEFDGTLSPDIFD